MDGVWHVGQLGNLTGRKPAGCTGTQEGNRRKHLRKTISGQGMFTDTSQIQGETKTCPNSAAADNPLCISQNFLTNIVNMSLGIEGFNVMCQSKQTQQMPENSMLYHFDYECETSTRGRLQNAARIFGCGLIAQCWSDHLLIKSLRLLARQRNGVLIHH